MKKVLTVKDIQEILGVCEKTAYSLIRQALATNNMFKVIKVGRLYKRKDCIQPYKTSTSNK